MDLGSLVSLLGALGLGSVLGQWIAASKDRRAGRAAALKGLMDMESARWAPDTDDQLTFAQAMREFEATVLIARVPRRYVRDYLTLAATSHRESLKDWERNPDPEFAGGIQLDLSELTRDTAALLRDVIWAAAWIRPVRFRLRRRRLAGRVKRLPDDVQRSMAIVLKNRSF